MQDYHAHSPCDYCEHLGRIHWFGSPLPEHKLQEPEMSMNTDSNLLYSILGREIGTILTHFNRNNTKPNLYEVMCM